MEKKRIVIAFFLAALANLAFAGDVAGFVDMGFSEDGKYFMFAQYGVHEGSLVPWAEMRIVDVQKNDFVPNGIFKYNHNESISPGQDGQGALMRLVSNNSGIIEHYGIPYLYQGVPLFISLLNGHEVGGDFIEFRDFDAGLFYTARIEPYVEGSGASTRSSFFITLTQENGGITRRLNVGSPEIKRKGVLSYSIKKVLVTRDRSGMVFVIEMRVQNGSGPDIRYMVETVRLK